MGAACLVLLLSDYRRLQKIALSVCSVQVALGSARLSLSSIFALFATLIFIFQSLTTFVTVKAVATTAHSTHTTVEMVDRLRMKEWRNDRNWWIALFACTVWLIVWRLQIWTRRYCLPAMTGCSDQVQTEGSQAKTRLKSPAEKKKD